MNIVILDLKFFMESFKLILNSETKTQISQLIVKIIKDYEDINEVDQEDILKVWIVNFDLLKSRVKNFLRQKLKKHRKKEMWKKH